MAAVLAKCFDEPAPVLDCRLMSGDNRNDELRKTAIAHRGHTLFDVLLHTRECGLADQLRGDEPVLLRLHRDAMTGMVQQIACIRWLEFTRGLHVALQHIAYAVRHRGCVDPALHVHICGAMQKHRRAWTRLRTDTRAIKRFTILEQTTPDPGGR